VLYLWLSPWSGIGHAELEVLARQVERFSLDESLAAGNQVIVDFEDVLEPKETAGGIVF
jgi:hypothetical protein